MQLVSISGGLLDFDDFKGCEQIDFYGIDIMLGLLDDACNGLTLVSLFRKIIDHIQYSLKTALTAEPTQYLFLKNEYQHRAIVPKEYAEKLLEY